MRPCLAVVARKLSAADDLGAHAAMAAAAARKYQLVAGAGPRFCFTQYECAGCTGDTAGQLSDRGEPGLQPVNCSTAAST